MSDRVLLSLYPEVRAGGFTRIDGTIEFYSRVNALLGPRDVVCDLGAGRGARVQEDRVTFRRRLRTLKGKADHVIGIDPDPVVLDNPGLDEARLLNEDGTLPLEDGSVDLIVSDWVLEHVREPELFAAEVTRVLSPGAWFCARTPNRWHYVALLSRLIPDELHPRIVTIVQDGREEKDVFPTAYRFNTMRRIRKHFPSSRFVDASYYYSAEPAYLPRNRILWGIAEFAARFAPDWLKQNLFVFVRKR